MDGLEELKLLREKYQELNSEHTQIKDKLIMTLNNLEHLSMTQISQLLHDALKLEMPKEPT